jgi:hypothetical protein
MRTTTWAILVWTALWVVLFVIWAEDPGQPLIGQGPGRIGDVRLKPPDVALFVMWFVGFVTLSVIWLATRWRIARHRGT